MNAALVKRNQINEWVHSNCINPFDLCIEILTSLWPINGPSNPLYKLTDQSYIITSHHKLYIIMHIIYIYIEHFFSFLNFIREIYRLSLGKVDWSSESSQNSENLIKQSAALEYSYHHSV